MKKQYPVRHFIDIDSYIVFGEKNTVKRRNFYSIFLSSLLQIETEHHSYIHFPCPTNAGGQEDLNIPNNQWFQKWGPWPPSGCEGTAGGTAEVKYIKRILV